MGPAAAGSAFAATPTLEEAVVAAQGLSDDIEQQVEIASGLMGVPQEEVRPVIASAAPSVNMPAVLSAARARCRRWLSSGGERCAEPPRDCGPLSLSSSENLGQNFTCDYLGIAFDEIEEASPNPRERLSFAALALPRSSNRATEPPAPLPPSNT